MKMLGKSQNKARAVTATAQINPGLHVTLASAEHTSVPKCQWLSHMLFFSSCEADSTVTILQTKLDYLPKDMWLRCHQDRI